MSTMITNLMMVLLIAVVGCGQPPAFVEQDPGSNAVPVPIPSGPGSKIDDTGENPDDETDSFDPDKEFYQVGQNFVAGSPVTDNLNFDLNDPFIESNLTMQRAYFDRSLNFKQVNRATITDQMNQGHPASPHTDNLIQDETEDLLDILVVVDNSGSMHQEQQNLSTKLAPLLQEISNSNWRIAINTTDPSRGCVNTVIKNTDSNVEDLFETAIVSASTYGSGNERGVLQSVKGLKAECLSEPWMRNDSSVAVLIVSDEDNCSNGTGCGSQPYGSPDYLSDHLSDIRALGVNARVYGLVWHPSQTSSQCSTGYNKANQYATLISQSNGTWGSICDSDYSSTLAAISTDIAESLNTQFVLSYEPNPGTVVVKVNGVLQSGNYTVTKNVLEFTSNVPAEGAQIQVDYEYDSAPIVSSFALSKDPDASTLKVYVNGQLQSPALYSYDAGDNEVDFNAPPANNALVTLQYREDAPALETDFALTGNVSAPSIEVKVNGVVQGSGYTYNSGANRIEFSSAPADDADIIVNYQEIGDPILAYAFSVDPNEVANIEVHDSVSGVPVSFSYAGGELNFAMADWQEGRVVIVKYPNANFGQMVVDLPQTPLANTVVAEASGVTCSGAQISVTGNSVSLGNCGFPPAATDVAINYLYLPSDFNKFTFSPEIPVELSEVLWEVSVNNVPVYNYTRDGRTFTLDNSVNSGDTVKIEANYYY